MSEETARTAKLSPIIVKKPARDANSSEFKFCAIETEIMLASVTNSQGFKSFKQLIKPPTIVYVIGNKMLKNEINNSNNTKDYE